MGSTGKVEKCWVCPGRWSPEGLCGRRSADLGNWTLDSRVLLSERMQVGLVGLSS